MKRFLTAALAALLLLTLPACGLLEKEENPPSQEPVSDPQPQEPEVPAAPTPEELAADITAGDRQSMLIEAARLFKFHELIIHKTYIHISIKEWNNEQRFRDLR